MSPKSLALVALAILVMAMGVYLFIQVKATPAQAGGAGQGTTTPPRRIETATESPIAQTREPKAAVRRPGTERAGFTPASGTDEHVATRPASPQLGTTAPEPQAADDQKVNLKMDTMMELANKAYDTQEFDQAIAIAGKLLAKDPNNVRMLRIMVSSSCIQGDSAVAQQHYERLPVFDREQMKQRCDRYGVTFKEPSQ